MPGKWHLKSCPSCAVGKLKDDEREHITEYRGYFLVEIREGAWCGNCDYSVAYSVEEHDSRWEKFKEKVNLLTNPKTNVLDKDWVNCPICDEPDMEKTIYRDEESLINCTNHACLSNGGTYQVEKK